MPSASEQAAAISGLERECREVMTPRVVTVEPDVTAREISRVMADKAVGAVLVVLDAQEPMGWVRRVDVTDAAPTTPAAELIGEAVTGIDPAASVRSARYALALPNVTHLAVRHRGQGLPIGVITVSDVGDPRRSLEKE